MSLVRLQVWCSSLSSFPHYELQLEKLQDCCNRAANVESLHLHRSFHFLSSSLSLVGGSTRSIVSPGPTFDRSLLLFAARLDSTADLNRLMRFQFAVQWLLLLFAGWLKRGKLHLLRWPREQQVFTILVAWFPHGCEIMQISASSSRTSSRKLID